MQIITLKKIWRYLTIFIYIDLIYKDMKAKLVIHTENESHYLDSIQLRAEISVDSKKLDGFSVEAEILLKVVMIEHEKDGSVSSVTLKVLPQR